MPFILRRNGDTLATAGCAIHLGHDGIQARQDILGCALAVDRHDVVRLAYMLERKDMTDLIVFAGFPSLALQAGLFLQVLMSVALSVCAIMCAQHEA